MRHLRGMSVGAISVVATAGLGLSACGTSYGSSTLSTQPPSRATVGAETIGGLGSVLTGSNGRTLYTLSTESRSWFQCTGGCTSTWMPYVVASGTTPTKASGVVGQVSTTPRPGGAMQVTFDGHPVYFYEKDSAQGQATGQGTDGAWFVLHASPKRASASAAGSSYGY